ncbi:MAG TPA: ankyrin repeat domain-containing protein [Acidimicrobiales bacterium]
MPTDEDLEDAADRGDVDGVRALLAAGADPNAENVADAPIFHTALRRGDEAMLRAFVGYGARIAAVGDNGRTVLHGLASSRDGSPLLRFVVDLGVDPNTQDATGWTALHLAAANGYERNVEALLAAGASPSVTTRHGLSPADVAARNGHDGIAARLRVR